MNHRKKIIRRSWKVQFARYGHDIPHEGVEWFSYIRKLAGRFFLRNRKISRAEATQDIAVITTKRVIIQDDNATSKFIFKICFCFQDIFVSYIHYVLSNIAPQSRDEKYPILTTPTDVWKIVIGVFEWINCTDLGTCLIFFGLCVECVRSIYNKATRLLLVTFKFSDKYSVLWVAVRIDPNILVETY